MSLDLKRPKNYRKAPIQEPPSWASDSRPVHDRPCASDGLTSYRYPSGFGSWIMIGAGDLADAVKEASRSLSHDFADVRKLEIWDGNKYVPAVEGRSR